ncbi:MAG TPA: DHHA1 domain-containing protein [Gemmatimonadales bacterium]
MSDALSPPRVPNGAVVAPARAAAAREIAAAIKPGMRIALTTHVNADGDGTGSEVAMWHLLVARGAQPFIVNPTPFPPRYAFLLDGADGADRSSKAVKQLARADLVIVLDISDLGRLGHLAERLRDTTVPVACIDHHASNGSLPPGPRLVDAAACATGELVFDLARATGWSLSDASARALYVAMLTDTGGFRFSNTTPRTLHVAAELLHQGVDPEEIYTRVYASAPEGRVRLLAEVLDTLVVESPLGLAWVTVPPGALERHGVSAEDLEGVVEFPRSIEGVSLALLFRQLDSGRIKVSFRSVGGVDVAELAERFGGGGHRRAAGASFEGTLAEVQHTVLQAARALLSPAAVAGVTT